MSARKKIRSKRRAKRADNRKLRRYDHDTAHPRLARVDLHMHGTMRGRT